MSGNHTFENWAHTLKFKPERFLEPESEAEVVDIVKDALARGTTVRTQGAGHCWSHFVVTDHTLIQLDELDKGLVADVPNLRYTVQAGIRLKRLIENLAADLKRIFDEGDLSTTLPVEVRFVANDNSLMSPARGRDVCYIGVSTQPNANEVYSRVEPIMKDFGGRPHWGKHFTLQRREVEAMYPDSYDAFRQIRKQLDPNGVFSNTLSRQLFD